MMKFAELAGDFHCVWATVTLGPTVTKLTQLGRSHCADTWHTQFGFVSGKPVEEDLGGARGAEVGGRELGEFLRIRP